MAEEISDTSPNRQAYTQLAKEGYKGRFAANIADIRLFKDNPYIKDLDQADRLELNKSLLTPYDGEQFYDDDRYVYLCKLIKDAITGEERYIYTSKEKEVNERLAYYESQGVLNQLMSAYNNGRIYTLYIDRSNLMMYPNTSLTWPKDYAYYTVKAQKLNEDNKPIYVAGMIQDNELVGQNIGMVTQRDDAVGTIYTRMLPAKIFTTEEVDPIKQTEVIKNNEFYQVDFFNSNGTLLDTRLFQAVDSTVTNTEVPSQSISDINVTVLRNNISQSSANGIYPVLAGEDVSNTLSFVVRVVYSDGTNKLVSLNSPNLDIEGLDNWSTENKPQGETHDVVIRYYANVDEFNKPYGTFVEKTIKFQIVANTTETIYKILPVMWQEQGTSVDSSIKNRIYRLKVFTLNNDGEVENKTRAFFNTFKKVDSDGSSVEFTDCPYIFDSYDQSMVFTCKSDYTVGSDTTFSFNLYTNGSSKEFRFVVKFGADASNYNGALISNYISKSSYGYEENGALTTLRETYDRSSVNLSNIAKLYRLDNTISIQIINPKGLIGKTKFVDRYKRKISADGTYLQPNRLQVYSVKDSTYTKLISDFPINSGDTDTGKIAPIGEHSVSILVNDLKDYDFILTKWVNDSNGVLTTTDIDVYVINHEQNNF